VWNMRNDDGVTLGVDGCGMVRDLQDLCPFFYEGSPHIAWAMVWGGFLACFNELFWLAPGSYYMW
jgi:hypothetical protein